MTNNRKRKNNTGLRGINGVHTDTVFIGEVIVNVSLNLADEAEARLRAKEVDVSASKVGTPMNFKEIQTQEKWERILLLLEELKAL